MEEINKTFSELTIADLWDKSVRLNSKNIALVCNGIQLTYSELSALVNATAQLLVDKGVKPESLVPICLSSGIELITGVLAILKAGGAYVPIDPEYPEHRIKYMLDDCNAKVIVTTSKYRSKLEGLYNADIIEMDSVAAPFATAELNTATILKPDNLAYVMYTSGTTGVPNGVMVEHRSVVNNLTWSQDYFKFSTADVVLQKTTFCFDVSVWEILSPLIAGSKLIIIDNDDYKDIEFIKDTVERHGVNFIHFVPTMLEFFLLSIKPGECGSLKRVICSGEALSPFQANLLKTRLPQAKLYNLYGPTETTIHSTYWAAPPSAEIATVFIGKPVNNTAILILNDQLELQEDGKAGEIFINGLGLARGYLNKPELTAERFVQNPLSTNKNDLLFKTGDFGKYAKDGNIEYLGRIDDQVKINGYRIELGSIESNIKNSGLVKHAVVLTAKNALGSMQIIAYVVLINPDTVNYLWDDLVSKLPAYMLPASIKEVEDIPFTANGKIDRDLLLQSGTNDDKNDSVAPRNDLESKLMTIWETLFKTSEISIYDNFFEFGGNSIMAIKMLSQIKKETGKRISYIQLNQFPTIEALAKILTRPNQFKIFNALVDIKPYGKKPPLYLVNGGELVADGFFSLSNFLDKEQPVYGFQSDGYDKNGKLFNSIEGIAAYYVQSIISHDNTGPYCLGGYSLGGPIAFEMAKQLKTAGRQVKLLAMIDSLTRDPGIIKTTYSLPTIAKVIAFNVSMLFKHGFAETVSYSKGVLHAALKKLKVISTDIPAEVSVTGNEDKQHAAFDVFALHADLYKKYKILPYEGNIVVFKARKVTYFMDDLKYLGWKPFGTKVKSITVNGDHFSIFKDEHVKNFGAQLQNVLDEGF